MPPSNPPPAITGLTDRLDALLRGERRQLANLLVRVETDTAIFGTKTRLHTHVIALNGNAMPRVADLALEAVSHLIDYAIPRSEIARAQADDMRLNQTRRVSQLRTKAKALFTDLTNSGEGGEVLLYMLVQAVLGLPQIFCKMPLKTSTAMHVHGVDGIHAGLDSATGSLALYWGESKLHSTIHSALTDCLDSLRPFLEAGGGSAAPAERELQLIRDNIDLNDTSLQEAVLRYLDRDDPAYNRLQLRGVGLVGFDLDVYPTVPNTITQKDLSASVRGQLASWIPYVERQLTSRVPLPSIHIELFLLPFPSVQRFRDAFLEELRNG